MKVRVSRSRRRKTEEGGAHEAGHEAKRDERERAPVGVYGGHKVVPREDGARAREETVEVQRGGV